jgi:hypothetical protein
MNFRFCHTKLNTAPLKHNNSSPSWFNNLSSDPIKEMSSSAYQFRLLSLPSSTGTNLLSSHLSILTGIIDGPGLPAVFYFYYAFISAGDAIAKWHSIYIVLNCTWRTKAIIGISGVPMPAPKTIIN